MWLMLLFSVCLCAAAFPSFKSFAQDEPAPATAPVQSPAAKGVKCKSLQQEGQMVLVNATVTDPYGRLVTGLDQHNFQIYEDNTEQEVVHFSSEDVPVSIGMIFDMSGSMANKFEKSRLAAV